MITIVGHVRVKDYARWREGFDELAPVRKRYGVEWKSVLQSVDDSNEVTVIGELRSAADLEAYKQSPEMKASHDTWAEPPTNWTMAGAAAMVNPPIPAVSMMVLSPMSKLASASEKPGKYSPSTFCAGPTNQRPGMEESWMPKSVPLRAITVSMDESGTPSAASNMHLAMGSEE